MTGKIGDLTIGWVTGNDLLNRRSEFSINRDLLPFHSLLTPFILCSVVNEKAFLISEAHEGCVL